MNAFVAQRLPRAALDGIGLTPAGAEYVVECATEPPARKVGVVRTRNLIAEVPLPELGVVLQAESMTGEFYFLVELRRQAGLLAVFDQPQSIWLEIVDRRGRPNRTTYTADYLVVTADNVTAYEVKAESALQELVKFRPVDWTYEAQTYVYHPAHRAFANLGIRHAVVSSDSLSRLRADNYRLLTATRRTRDEPKFRKARQAIRVLFQAQQVWRASDLAERLGDRNITPALQLVDEGELFADVDTVSLTEPSSLWLATTIELAKTAQRADVTLGDALRSAGELTTQDWPDPRHYATVALRYAAARGGATVKSNGKPLSKRTIRRYAKALRNANGDPTALVPKWGNCGNTDARTTSLHEALIKATVRAGRADRRDPSAAACYRRYADQFDENRTAIGFTDGRPISRTTFYARWELYGSGGEEAREKGGRRLQNALIDQRDPLAQSIAATRPFSIAHIDHWKVDLFLVAGVLKGKPVVYRPWLTGLIDAFNDEVLALWLSFSDPSKKSCSMVIRDCVRRHGRLPEMIMADGGSDFKSAHYLLMLATNGVTRVERPPEDPRFGHKIERLWGHFKERFARGLPGYGVSLERARAVSAAMHASKNAELDLLEAFEALESYAFCGYNNVPPAGESIGRTDLRIQAEERLPRGGVPVEWDLRFLVSTSIEAPDSGYTLRPGAGVCVGGKTYRSTKLLEYRGYKKDLDVRLEPYVRSVVYVCIDGKWLVCYNTDAPREFAMSDRALIHSTSVAHDLGALRREIREEMERAAASLLDTKIEKLTARRPTSTAARPAPATPAQLPSPLSSDMGAQVPEADEDEVPYEIEIRISE